ncbi:MAG: hypothetical protein ABI547_00880 [Betaproteobacteria bacterium]
MSLEMQVKPGDDYLTIMVRGAFDLHLAIELTPRIFDACAAHRASRLLIDGRTLTGTMTTTERYIYADNFANQYKARRIAGSFKRMQIAVVGSHEIVDPLRFGEKVLTMRGIHAKVLTDVDQALTWLGMALVPEDDTELPIISRV